MDMSKGNLNGPNHLVSSFMELKLDPKVRILDICAGTGLVAQLVKIIFLINVALSYFGGGMYSCSRMVSPILTPLMEAKR